MKPKILNIVGVSSAVRMPLSVSPRLAYAPYFPLISMAADVPTACDAVPSDNPCAMGLLTFMICNVLKPSTAPSKPTQTTTAAVSDGMPPMVFVTSMAIGRSEERRVGKEC